MSYSGDYDSVEDFTKMSGLSTSGNPSSMNVQSFSGISNGVSGGKKSGKKEKPVLSAAAKERKFLSSVRSFIIVIALSIHSVFEGMAIGKKFNTVSVQKLD